MRRVVPSLSAVIFAAFTSLSLPATSVAQPMDVALGQDLTAWQMLEHRRLDGDAAVVSYRRFVETYGASPLATAAWGRLVALHADVNWGDDAASRAVIDGVRDQWMRLETSRVLARHAAVASIDLTERDDDAAVMDEDDAATR